MIDLMKYELDHKTNKFNFEEDTDVKDVDFRRGRLIIQ
jgi:hypothetical protein